MKMIETLAAVKLGPGALLTLSDNQARTRGHALKPVGNGVYQTTAHVEFKAGEVFGLDGELPKSMRVMVKADGEAMVTAELPAAPTGPVKFVMPVARDIPPGAKKRK